MTIGSSFCIFRIASISSPPHIMYPKFPNVSLIHSLAVGSFSAQINNIVISVSGALDGPVGHFTVRVLAAFITIHLTACPGDIYHPSVLNNRHFCPKKSYICKCISKHYRSVHLLQNQDECGKFKWRMIGKRRMFVFNLSGKGTESDVRPSGTSASRTDLSIFKIPKKNDVWLH